MFEASLRQLASLSEKKSPFLTLYIDTQKHDESQKDRIRLFLKHESNRIREALDGNGDDAIERGIRQIESYVENSIDPSTRGVAIFSCPDEDLFIPLQLPVPVEPQLTIDSRPQLRQLVQLRQLNPLVALAMVDAKSARLFEIEFGRVLFEIDLQDLEMPRRHDQGGWSQSNMQRHVQDHIDRHHKDVAETLSKMVDAGRVSAVILSGQERSLANFRGFLPKRLDGKIIGILHLDIRSSVDEITEACSGVILSRQAADQQGRLAQLEETAQKAGRGALGIDAVTDSVNQRRIETLYLSRDFESRGWKCTSCGIVGESIPLGCPACGSDVLTVDLAEQWISAAECENARVEIVDPGSILDRYQGVGAFLRF